MNTFYTDERNIQILIYLMKAHGIRKVIASPGTTNLTFVASIQSDPYFEIYSSADERSAAYIACGMAAESNEAVALSCTGATASRNYIPGLTEAFYRKLPILAITSTQHIGRIGQNMPQVIDRSLCMKDIVRLSVNALQVHGEEDEWACGVSVNNALLELTHKGGGPVHINLATSYSKDFSIQLLPEIKVIKRILPVDSFPVIEAGNIAIFVGSHTIWSRELTEIVDCFCELYNAVVLCDQTSNYRGKYRVLASIVAMQSQYKASCCTFDLMIHIGDVSGAEMPVFPKQVWRVNPDGEVRDTFRKLKYIFEMNEIDLFEHYVKIKQKDSIIINTSFYEEWMNEREYLINNLPELPFSNMWITSVISQKLPENSILHMGILNTLRCWSFFETQNSVKCFSNTGGFGIDGNLSSLVGASLVHPENLYFGIVGDLACFYDLNSLGNRHIGSNLRIMVVNNGKGTEFRNYNHPASRFGEDADLYMAAGGHYGNKISSPLRNYSKDLGFEYIKAGSKKEFISCYKDFLSTEPSGKSIIFEIFTDSGEESKAIEMMHNIRTSVTGKAKKVIKEVLGDKSVQKIKQFINH